MQVGSHTPRSLSFFGVCTNIFGQIMPSVDKKSSTALIFTSVGPAIHDPGYGLGFSLIIQAMIYPVVPTCTMLAQVSKSYYSVRLFLPETRIKFPCYMQQQVPNTNEDAFQMSLVPGGFRGLPPTCILYKGPSTVLLVRNTSSATLRSQLHCISFSVSFPWRSFFTHLFRSVLWCTTFLTLHLSFYALHCLCLPSYNLWFFPAMNIFNFPPPHKQHQGWSNRQPSSNANTGFVRLPGDSVRKAAETVKD